MAEQNDREYGVVLVTDEPCAIDIDKSCIVVTDVNKSTKRRAMYLVENQQTMLKLLGEDRFIDENDIISLISITQATCSCNANKIKDCIAQYGNIGSSPSNLNRAKFLCGLEKTAELLLKGALKPIDLGLTTEEISELGKLKDQYTVDDIIIGETLPVISGEELTNEDIIIEEGCNSVELLSAVESFLASIFEDRIPIQES